MPKTLKDKIKRLFTHQPKQFEGAQDANNFNYLDVREKFFSSLAEICGAKKLLAAKIYSDWYKLADLYDVGKTETREFKSCALKVKRFLDKSVEVDKKELELLSKYKYREIFSDINISNSDEVVDTAQKLLDYLEKEDYENFFK